MAFFAIFAVVFRCSFSLILDFRDFCAYATVHFIGIIDIFLSFFLILLCFSREALFYDTTHNRIFRQKIKCASAV